MNLATARVPFWRERWFRVAGIIAVIQFVVFWTLSPPAKWTHAVPPPAKDSFVVTDQPPPALEHWLSLMTPSLILTPSMHDFSGRAWLEDPRHEIAFEQLTANNQPLPFRPVAAATGGMPLMARADPRPTSRWTVPPMDVPLPNVPPVPLARAARWRIEAGLTGWRVPEAVELPNTPEGVHAPTILQVVIDSSGELATPPLLYKSSGSPQADQVALSLAARLRMERLQAGDTGIDVPPPGSGEWIPGLLALDWGAGPENKPR